MKMMTLRVLKAVEAVEVEVVAAAKDLTKKKNLKKRKL